MLKLKTNISADSVVVLLKDAVTEFYRAVDKHPLWPDALTTQTPEDIEKILGWYRDQNDEAGGASISGFSVFMEEWFEFLEAAIIKRDRAAARHELAQCVAMLLRIGVHLDDYLTDDEQETQSPEFEPCDVCGGTEADFDGFCPQCEIAMKNTTNCGKLANTSRD